MVTAVTLELVRMPSGILTYRLSADVDGVRSENHATYLRTDSEVFDEAAILLPARPDDGHDPSPSPHTVLQSSELTSFDDQPQLVNELRLLTMRATGDYFL